MNKIRIPSKKKLFSDKFFTLATGTLGAYILPIIFLPILTRIYTPNEFSLYAIYITIIQITSMFSTFKFDLAIPVTDSYDDKKLLLRLSVINMFISSILVGLFLFIYSIFFNSFPSLLVYLIPYGIILHCIFTHILYNWLLSKKKLGLISMGKIIFGVFSSLLPIIIFFLFNLKDYSYIIFSHQISLLLVLIIILINLYGSSTIKVLVSIFDFRFSEIFSTVKKYKKYALFSSPSSLMNIFGIWVPVLFIWVFFEEKYVSLFFLSLRAVSFPLQILGDSVGKIFYSEATQNIQDGILSETISKYFKLLFHIAYAFLIFSLFFSVDLFSLIFNPDWSQSSLFVMILSPLFFVRLLGSPISTIPTILYRQEIEFKFQLILFLTRLSGLIIGVFFKNLYLALILFSFASTFCWLIYLFILLRMGGLTIHSLLIDTIKEKTYYLLSILILTLLIKILFLEPTLIFISLVILLLYFLNTLLFEIRKI